MATDFGVAKRYAAALFCAAEHDGDVDIILKDLELIEACQEQIPLLRAMLRQPLITQERKRHVLRDAFGNRITATTLNFLYLLVRKRRINQLTDVVGYYRAMVDEKHGSLIAHVDTAVALDKNQLAALKKALGTRTGKNIDIQPRIDSSMIGGVRVRIGDTIIDGSISSRLERVRKQFLGIH